MGSCFGGSSAKVEAAPDDAIGQGGEYDQRRPQPTAQPGSATAIVAASDVPAVASAATPAQNGCDEPGRVHSEKKQPVTSAGPADGPKRRGRAAAASSIDEVGQTNSPTVGPNFVNLLQKANDEAGEPRGPVHLLQGLRELGFTKLADDLVPYDKAACREAPMEVKNKLWARCAYDYTLEDSGDTNEAGESMCLYRMMNTAIRNDDPALDHWAPFVGVLIYGGDREDFAHYRNCLAPESVRPRCKQTTYRGFAMDPALKSRYEKGRVFFWQAFVSTSKDKDTSMEFAQKAAGEGSVPFLFEITVPAYKELDFWAFELQEVSEFPEEEVLLLPYTRFKSTEDPSMDDEGVMHVYIEATDVPFVNVMNKVVIMVDPSGFRDGSNMDMAKKAFWAATPKFRDSFNGKLQKRSWGQYTEYGVLAGALDAMALFTDSKAAIKYINGELRKKPATMFLIVVSGSASDAFIGEYSSSDTCNPCQILIFCGDVPKWKKHWEHLSNVRVTDNVDVAVDFCEPRKYDIQKDQFIPLRKYSLTYKRGCEEKMTIYYTWREIENGILYAGAGSYSYYVGKDWNQATGQLPAPPMYPLDPITDESAACSRCCNDDTKDGK